MYVAMTTKSKSQTKSDFNFELRGYKELPGDETPAFEAKLHFNNSKKPVCLVSNEGRGGDTSYLWLDNEAEKKFIEYVNKLAKEKVFDEYYEYYIKVYFSSCSEPPALEQFVTLDTCIEHLILEFRIKKACKKKTCFTLKKNNYGEFYEVNMPFSEKTKQSLVKRFGENLKEVLNERYAN
jgi:hypothetical protein